MPLFFIHRCYYSIMSQIIQIINTDEVKHIVKLANLQVSDKELELYTKQLQEIIGYVEKLREVDTLNVEPTYQTIDGVTNVWREDEVRPSLTQEEARPGAKRVVEGCFVTANVFGEIKRNKDYKGYKLYKAGIREKIDKFNAA